MFESQTIGVNEKGFKNQNAFHKRVLAPYEKIVVNPLFKNNSEWLVQIVCHRGLNSLAPENSLASTLLALACGFSHVEIDIRTTADKKLIVNHDSTFNRTSNFKGYVNQTHSSNLDKIEVLGSLSRRKLKLKFTSSSFEILLLVRLSSI